MIYTFYSFKGGVGRSMALANVAEWLVLKGARVVVVDFDLEAPGIEQFFFRTEQQLVEVRSQPGLLELLSTYRRYFDREARANPDIESTKTFAAVVTRLDLRDYLNLIQQETDPEGKSSALWLLTAGRRVGKDLAEYGEAVQDLDWDEFFRGYQGEDFFDWLRSELAKAADAVFVDSRTGITEIGGVCTRHLADVVVAFSAPNEQNLNGTILMARSFRRKEILEARNGKPDVIFVPSRVESAELESRNQFKELFQLAAKEFLPPVFQTLARSFWDLQIPYVARFSYGEALAVGGPPSARVIEAEEMTEAYRRLAAHLVLLAPQDSVLRSHNAEDLQRFVALSPAQSGPEKLWRSVFISYVREDGEQLADMLRARLLEEAPDITVWIDRQSLKPGSDWEGEIKSAISSVESVVAVMTPSVETSPWVLRELNYARREGVRVLPVMAGDLRFQSLPLWLRKYHFFDLRQDWGPFLHQLRVPYRKVRVPFMAPELTQFYVDRELREQICGQLLAPIQGYGTIVLAGPAGIGKTVLANAVTRDDRVLEYFEDGVLWAQFNGAIDPSLNLLSLYEVLTGERSTNLPVDASASYLARSLENKRCLIVLDDVEDQRQCEPFLRVGEECARIITTRRRDLVPHAAVVVVGSMTRSEVDQLAQHLPKESRVLFGHLADSLDHNPLAVSIAAKTILERVDRGDDPASAAEWLQQSLARRGVQSLPGLVAVIGSVIKALDPEHQARLESLACLDKIEVPLETAAALWNLDLFEAEETAQQLERTSFVQLDLKSRSITMHDLLRRYYIERRSAGQPVDQEEASRTRKTRKGAGWSKRNRNR
jgi:hypothetical protein